jgi:hypothetical protein
MRKIFGGMREATKLLLAAAAAMLLTIGLIACGGDDSEEPKTGSAATTTEQQTAPTTSPDSTKEGDSKGATGSTGGGAGKEEEPADDSGGASGGADDSGSAGSGNSGSGNSASGGSSSGKSSGSQGGNKEFITPGGDNTIQEFGEEGSAAERRAASTVVVAFVRARAAGDWETVCAHMSATTLQPVEKMAQSIPQYKGKGCAEILVLLTGEAPESFRASSIKGGIDSLRVKGDRAFALYRGTDGENYWVPLIKEGGQWKVGLLAPRTLPG